METWGSCDPSSFFLTLSKRQTEIFQLRSQSSLTQKRTHSTIQLDDLMTCAINQFQLKKILFQYMCNRSRPQCTFSITTNAQNVALGQKGVYSYITTTFGDEKTSVCVWNKQVSQFNRTNTKIFQKILNTILDFLIKLKNPGNFY